MLAGLHSSQHLEPYFQPRRNRSSREKCDGGVAGPFVDGTPNEPKLCHPSPRTAKSTSSNHALIFLNERFPTVLRSTGTGLSWNIGFAIGEVMPAVVSLAAPSTQSLPTMLSVFLFGTSVLFLLGAVTAPEAKGVLH